MGMSAYMRMRASVCTCVRVCVGLRVCMYVCTRVIFYVRREVDLMKTAKVNAYIMHIFGKIELLSIHAT